MMGLFAQEAGAPTIPKKEELQTCLSCGQTYRSFKESGRLGCASCYDAFEERLLPLLKKVQKGDRHIGKRPLGLAEPSREERLVELRKDLQRAITREEFERAARLRDEIRDLENNRSEQEV